MASLRSLVLRIWLLATTIFYFSCALSDKGDGHGSHQDHLKAAQGGKIGVESRFNISAKSDNRGYDLNPQPESEQVKAFTEVLSDNTLSETEFNTCQIMLI